MKFLSVLVLIMASFSFGQVNQNDPNMSLNKDVHTTATVSDAVYKTAVSTYDNVASESHCPNCATPTNLVTQNEDGTTTAVRAGVTPVDSNGSGARDR